MVVDTHYSVPVPGNTTGARTDSRMEGVYRMETPSEGNVLANEGLVGNLSRSQCAVTNLEFVVSDSAAPFAASVQLSIVTQAILLSLYSAASPSRSSEETQQEMTRFERRLDQWVASLPNRLNFEQVTDALDTDWNRRRILFGFQVFSARILLGQQCFYAYIRRQSLPMRYEAHFAFRMSSICLNAAKAIIDFLPDEPRADFIYNQCPWWCFVHHLMQAVSIFLLGLLSPRTSPEHGMPLVRYVNKTIAWLQVMDHPAAQRAEQRIRYSLRP